MEQTSLYEHLDVILIIVGLLWTGLLACLLFIFNDMRNKITSVEHSLMKLTDELFDRLRLVENSVSTLWGEHRATHENSKK